MWRLSRRIVDARRRARAQAGAGASSIAGGGWRREAVLRARSLFIDADSLDDQVGLVVEDDQSAVGQPAGGVPWPAEQRRLCQ